jgi:DNA-binding CsgD family transcriptional regulator
MLFSFSKNEEIVRLSMELDTIRKEVASLPMPHLFLRTMQSRRRDVIVQTIQQLGKIPIHPTAHRQPLDIPFFLEEHLYNWSGFERTINPVDIADIVFPGQNTTSQLAPLEKTLTYIQMSQDHPVIQSALLYISILSLIPDDPTRHARATLVTRFRLATSGFDIQGMDLFEEHILVAKNDYDDLLTLLPNSDNATQWIIFFMNIMKKSLQSTSELLQAQKRIFTTNPFLLTPRQIKILSLFNEQNIQLSNREIREHFDLSPITIARELTALVQHEYLIPIGKGRSVRYAKIV